MRTIWRFSGWGACLALFLTGLLAMVAKGGAGDSNPHLSGKVVVPAGQSELGYCLSCHKSGCAMPHPEHVAVNWQPSGRVALENGEVTCSSCHTPGFRHRQDAFLARDQKGLCSNCHFGAHALPDAHPFATPCESCHTIAKASLTAANPRSEAMVDSINGECLRCHYDGPITHPVGIKNTKNPAPDLPLGSDGAITCVTCHFGHSDKNKFGNLLRKDNRRGGLCLSCHDDL